MNTKKDKIKTDGDAEKTVDAKSNKINADLKAQLESGITHAVVIDPDWMGSAAALNTGVFSSEYEVRGIPAEWKERAQKAWEYYIEEPIVSNTINTWRTFAIGDMIKVSADDDQVRDEADKLASTLSINRFIKDMILQLLVKGDCIGYKRYGTDGKTSDKKGEHNDIVKLICVNPASVEFEFENGSDAIFGLRTDNSNGNEFKDNEKRQYYDDVIIFESRNSYPPFDDRSNNFYQGDMTYFIEHDTLTSKRYVTDNYWGSASGPDTSDFYPFDDDTVYYDFADYATERFQIGGDPDSRGKSRGKKGLDGNELDNLEAAIALELEGKYAEAVSAYQSYISTGEDEIGLQIAMRRLLIAYKTGGYSLNNLGTYYQSVGLASPSSLVTKTASLMQTKVKEAMGDYLEAILDYEEILLGNPSYEDSIYAVIDAGWDYLMMGGEVQQGLFNPQLPEIEPESWEEYDSMKWELLNALAENRKQKKVAGDGLSGSLNTEIPIEYALHQNYPNPFNPATIIRYDIRETSNVKIEIYNIMGQKVITLVDGLQTAGYKQIMWNGFGTDGKPVSSGIYIYTMTANGGETGEKFERTSKMILLK